MAAFYFPPDQILFQILGCTMNKLKGLRYLQDIQPKIEEKELFKIIRYYVFLKVLSESIFPELLPFLTRSLKINLLGICRVV